MRSIFVFLLVGFLMIGLVAGAGYSISVPAATVPAATTDSSGGGGGGGGGVIVNATANETSVGNGAVVGDSTSGNGSVSEGVEKIAEFVEGFEWKIILVVLGVLVVLGGITWYFLKSGRKSSVRVRMKRR